MLLAERRELLAEVRDLDDLTISDMKTENANDRATAPSDTADMASNVTELELTLNLRSLEAQQLAEIDEALRAIASGNYGICQACGQPIDIERLKVKPMARFCVPCLKAREGKR